MGREHLAGFLAKASGNPILARAVREQDSIEGLISLGNQEGFEFTAKELAMLRPEEGELSDEELESVASGGNPMSMIYCVFKESINSANEDADYWKKKLGL